MSGSRRYLDSDTRDMGIQFIRDGVPLEIVAGRLHFDTEWLGRLLQLPVIQPVATPAALDLWAVDRLDGVL